MMTDKVRYKPGETIWFRAFAPSHGNQQANEESGKLFLGTV